MNYAIIVAGGSGKRMNNLIPKQFLELNGKPILFHTLKRFLDFDSALQIILVLPEEFTTSDFLNSYFPNHKNIKVVVGGTTRFHSVQNGLNAIEASEGIVFIHDGVRPFVSNNVLETCLKTALEYGNAIPCLELKDSIRQITSDGNISISRENYRVIQTPQTFKIKEIQNAFTVEYNSSFTDEATVFELAGNKIYLVHGNEENIKITTPIDLEIAKSILLRNDFI